MFEDITDSPLLIIIIVVFVCLYIYGFFCYLITIKYVRVLRWSFSN